LLLARQFMPSLQHAGCEKERAIYLGLLWRCPLGFRTVLSIKTEIFWVSIIYYNKCMTRYTCHFNGSMPEPLNLTIVLFSAIFCLALLYI